MLGSFCQLQGYLGRPTQEGAGSSAIPGAHLPVVRGVGLARLVARLAEAGLPEEHDAVLLHLQSQPATAEPHNFRPPIKVSQAPALTPAPHY